ncbi:MAG TPA: hypothetical protein VL125_02540 [Pelobium sp.]|nr:hypothetical protein [Pelobium sp.]
MIATHEIENVRFVDDFLILDVDGKKYELHLHEVSTKTLERK